MKTWPRLGALALTVLVSACGRDEPLDYILRLSAGVDEPPENPDVGLIAYVQAAASDSDPRGAVLTLQAIGGEVADPSAGTRGTALCRVATVVASPDLADAPATRLVVYPEGRSARVLAQLWRVGSEGEETAAAAAEGCAVGATLELLDARDIVVPPDESLDDVTTSPPTSTATEPTTESSSSSSSSSGTTEDSSSTGTETGTSSSSGATSVGSTDTGTSTGGAT